MSTQHAAEPHSNSPSRSSQKSPPPDFVLDDEAGINIAFCCQSAAQPKSLKLASQR